MSMSSRRTILNIWNFEIFYKIRHNVTCSTILAWMIQEASPYKDTEEIKVVVDFKALNKKVAQVSGPKTDFVAQMQDCMLFYAF